MERKKLLKNSVQSSLKSLSLNVIKSYKLERVLFKTLEYFPSALFPKLWNSIELELTETKSAKLLTRKLLKTYSDSYATYICKKNNCFSCG